MYPVAYGFHALAIQDAPKTRARIYFIGDGVDCTDDNDVQTNGTLLVGAVGDTDSNGRISETGITFNEFFNPEKNVYVGDCVSSQISMTLLNYDGALDGYTFGRCKVYLDVYDADNSVWLPCPMGVYLIEQPTKTRQRLISVHGFDQMQKFDSFASAWWNAIDWTNGITLYDLVVSMATELGFSVSSTSQSVMEYVNKVPFYAPPTDCKNVTYRDVLGIIAEGSGSWARFDRDGALDLRCFNMYNAVSPYVIDTDSIGNRCFSIDISENTVSKYGTLLYRVTSDNDFSPITLPGGENKYIIQGNPFLNPNNIDVIKYHGATGRLTPLTYFFYRLRQIDEYRPINGRFIMDWSLESGDRISIINNGTTYSFPMYQQTMTWRGGYVVSEAFNDGDTIRPETDYRSNEDFKTYSQKTRVADAEINNTGWYRAIQYGSVSVPYSKGYSGIVFNIAITREGTAESHNIQYLASAEYDSNAGVYVAKGLFANETSNAQNGYVPYCIDKIRYVYGDTANDNGYNFAYIDIHMNYVFSGNDRVHFQFDCVTQEADQSFAISAGLTPVADTPANQIIQSVYSFSPVAINKTQKVATATLGSQGWYRVFSYNGSSSADVAGDNGVVAHLAITRNNDNDQSETHSIDLNIANGNIAFSNEKSISSVLGVDKIRYTTTSSSPYNGYIEIHYNLNTENTVTATCTVDGNVDELQRFNSIYVISVPSPETIQAEHTFSKTGAVENIPAVFNSTVDVTNRRCSATLSSAGWYRVMTVTNHGLAAHAWVCDLTITRVYNHTNNEAHCVKLMAIYDSFSFVDETSKTNASGVDKIRYTHNGSIGYVDIHYSLSTSNDVSVSFDIHTEAEQQYRFTASGLSSVADAPTGETVRATYEFAADTRNGSILIDDITVGSATIAAGAAKSITKSLSKAGYTPIAVAGFYGTSNGNIAVGDCYINASGVLNMYLINTGTSSRTPTMYAKILWQKD